MDAEGADVHGGPGREYYVVDRLAEGITVDVYRHAEDGWLAIRPPNGSFSWVKRGLLKIKPGSIVAEVKSDGAVCRVGTALPGINDYVFQVRLRKGEHVELLDMDPDLPADVRALVQQGWVRIAPPAGEFRWVQRASLRAEAGRNETDLTRSTPREPTIAVAETIQSSNDEIVGSAPPTSPREASGGSSSTPSIKSANNDQSVEDSPTGVRTAGTWQPREPREMTATREPPPARSIAIPADTAAADPKQIAASDTASAAVSSAPLRTPPKREVVRIEESHGIKRAAPQALVEANDETSASMPATDIELSAEDWVPRGKISGEVLDQMELELAENVAREVRAWRLVPLERRLLAIGGRLASTADRVRAQHLLDRIREFQQLQNQLASSPTTQLRGPTGQTDPPLAQMASDPPDAVEPLTGVRYDASGWLVAVHTSKPTAPPYALLDSNGDVLHYVSPAPGLNLHRYLRKQIGLYGPRGFVPSLQKPHVTAERVIDIERHVR